MTKLLDQQGRVISVSPDRMIGEGHEAQVFSVSASMLAKIYRSAQSYTDPTDSQAAKIRLQVHQKKLLDFPTDLPPGAVGPMSPLWSYKNWLLGKRRAKIAGYMMPWITDAEEIDYYMIPRSRAEGVTDETVVRALINLHETLRGLHEKGLIIGDLNHGNVLVKETQAWAIDLDAGQFGEYLCNTFEPDYLDPLLMDTDPQLMVPILRQDRFYSVESDWYSYTCIVLACLTYTKPYQGAYKGQLKEERRPLDRLSVFHPKVIFPQYGGARHWNGLLPDDLIGYLSKVFSREDLRGEFPIELLQALLPGSARGAASHLKSKRHVSWPTVEKSKAVDKHMLGLLFETNGALDPITQIQGDALRYLYSTAGNYTRDHRHVVIANETRDEYLATGQYRFHILHGDQTVTVYNSEATLHTPRSDLQTFPVDQFGEIPSLSSNGQKLAWYSGKRMMVAYDTIKEQRVVWESPYETNMVWVTPLGRLVSYHRTSNGARMTARSGEVHQDLLVDFGHNRPRDLRIFEDTEYLWVWTWHDAEIRVQRFDKNGKHGLASKFKLEWAPKPNLVCLQQGTFLTVTSEQQLTEISLNPVPKKKVVLDIPLRALEQLLPHPQTGGVAVLSTKTQLWQLTRKER